MDNPMTPRLGELADRIRFYIGKPVLVPDPLLSEAADAISRLMAEGGLSKEPPAAQAWKEVIETLRTLATLSIYDDDTYTSTIAVNLESDLGEVIDALTALQANEGQRLARTVLTHPEAQGNKDLGEPPLTRLEEVALEAERKYAAWIMAAINRHAAPEKDQYGMTAEARALAEFQHAMSQISCLRLQAQRVAQAAPTTPQPIKGESELESASNGMGLR
jgi:hypothetical protein